MTALPDTCGPSDGDQFARIVEDIRARGYTLVTDCLPQPLLHGLFVKVKDRDEQAFKTAGVGREDSFQINRFVRGDRIAWVDGAHSELSPYMQWLETLRLRINEALFLGLFDYECHYAYYPRGAFYKKHVDAFRGQSNRRLSTVLYLNPAWQPHDGGELVLYAEDGETILETVAPAFGTMAIFLSEVFPHEVLPTQRTRYSLTGWFRVNGGDGQVLDVPR